MKALIIYKSVHHGNTEKIAKVMANALEADLLDLKNIRADIIEKYDLIGFGSGIYYSKPHKKLIKFVEELNNIKNKKAFVFSTSGIKKSEFNDLLKNKLSKKGFEVIGEFNCKGFDTVGPLKLIGGINKGKPNEEDFKNANIFALDLKEKMSD
ncbi:MAG TPA: flavodoxin family protein [Methanobacterium sp.]|nr:flavodoxin family protein [Methanobacterium sp.]